LKIKKEAILMDRENDSDKAYFEEASRKQYKEARKIVSLIFGLLGLLFLILGLCFYFSSVVDEDGTPLGYVFVPVGLFLLILGLGLFLFLPREGNYERFKARVDKGAILDTNEMAVQAAILQKRIEKLEERVGALEKEKSSERADWHSF